MTPAATRAVSIDSSHVALDCVGQGRFRVTISATIARTLLGLLGGLAPALAGAQLAEPLHIRNLNPLVAVFGLPAWDTVPLGTRLGVTAEVANHYRFSVRGDDLLNLDGETFRTNVSLTHGFGGGWSLGVEIPYYRIGGGVLDDVIDGWHSAFGLPDGGRNGRAEGLFLYRYGDSTNPSFLLTEPQSGIGDTQIKFARRFGEDQGFIVQASVKLPTGEEEMLAGSGSGDWSVTLLRSQPLVGRKRPAGYFWGFGLVRAGDPHNIDFDAETWVPTGVVGGSWQPWPKFGLKGQLDVHGAFFDSPLEEIGEPAIQTTLAAWRRIGERGTLEFGVVEALAVSTAPDVVLHVAAVWQW
jgi:hypothetical protein